MKQQRDNFREFLRTPFPYLSLVLTIFLASTLLGNQSFRAALQQEDNAASVKAYELCIVCSDPNAKDAMSDVGFTVANFILFPVNVISFSISDLLNNMFSISGWVSFAVYLSTTLIYGIVAPFLLFSGFAFIDRYSTTAETPSFTGS